MFIDFEGIDGSGKTTLSNILAERLDRLGYRVTHAREGGELKAPIARRVREMTRDLALLEMSARTEFLLNVARDTQQLEEVIKPALRRGDVCISDRFLYSQLAHSGGGRGLDPAELERTVEFAAQGVWPDLVILVDVDPELARLRKRVSKATADETKDGSRKGLVGAGLSVRVRESFLKMARKDPSRWLVIENNDQPLTHLADRIFEVVKARLEGREPEVNAISAGAPRWPAPTIDTLESSFFAAVDELELREPKLALYLLDGIPGLAAHQRRLRQAAEAPRLVARTLSGLHDDASWELRELLVDVAPREVLGSLGGIPNDRAMALRERLFDRCAREAVSGLKRDDSEAAWALRERALVDGELEGVILGLAGLSSPRAWEVRAMGLRKGMVATVARSLTGLSDAAAEATRADLFGLDRVAVLRSTTGLETDQARRFREALFEKAPKVVLRTLTGVDAAYAWRMRVQAAPLTKEALDSVDGMDAPEAWALRDKHAGLWPSTAISSLRDLALTERGQELIDRVLSANPRRISVLRNAWAAMSRARMRTALASALSAEARGEARTSVEAP